MDEAVEARLARIDAVRVAVAATGMLALRRT
jgi:hypothetical protein